MLANVQKLHVNTVENRILTFLKGKRRNSIRTEISYKGHIVQFFKWMHGKELNQLTDEDILFTHEQIDRYSSDLLEGIVTGKPMSASTINVKMSAIKSLYEFMSKDNKKIDITAFNVDNVKGEQKSAGHLSWDEAKMMIENARKMKDGLEKSIMLEVASRTSIRLNALSNLKWKNIKWDNEENEWVVEVWDKGQKLDEKPIPQRLYDEMKTLTLDHEPETKIFSLSSRLFQRTIELLVKEFGWKDRNISFHSLKGVAINWIIDHTGSMLDGAIQGNHKNIQTTYKNYAKKKRKWKNMAGLRMGEEQDLTSIKNLTHEQLLNIIEKASSSTQAELLRLANSVY